MRIAICFSGALRQFKSCYSSFEKHILKAGSYDVDIFVSIWNTKIRHFKKQVADEGSFSEMKNLYSPVSVNIEDYDKNKRQLLYLETKMDKFQRKAQKEHRCRNKHRKDKCRFCGSNNIHNQIGQLYNIWKANQLKSEYEIKNNFKYDLVIRNRFDNLFFSSLTDSVAEQVSNGNVWVPYGFDDLPEYGGGINDQFAIGSSESMDFYSSMFPNMYDLAMKRGMSKEGYGIPHKTILDICNDNNIQVSRFWLKYVLAKKLDLYKKRTKGITDEQYKELRV